MKTFKIISLSLLAMSVSGMASAQFSLPFTKKRVASSKPITAYVKTNYPILAGTQWEPKNQIGQYVGFDSSGGITGFGGCNSFTGNYFQDDRKMQIPKLGATKNLCEGTAKEEAAFLKNLSNARSLEMFGASLNVYDPNDHLVLTLNQRKISKK